ncbi:MAG TPA: hypothetical protein VIH86_16025 [Puia sp.]
MKLTIKNISNVLDKTQEKYSVLFDDLILLKNFASKKFNPRSVFSFQYTLGQELFHLASLRNEITLQEKKLIDRKKSLNNKWFVAKMKLYKNFKSSIDNCISIGKTFGDAFAWHFYQFNLPELFKHLGHEEIKFFATGVGGTGELEFIKKHVVINNHFALLHGVTHFLRIGDISLMSLKDFHLTSIAEIKTMRTTEDEITVSLTAVNAKDRKFVEDLEQTEVAEEDFYNEYFNPDRFRRQVKKMVSVLKPDRRKDEDRSENIIYDNYYINELEEVVDGLKKTILPMKKINGRLLYTANRIYPASFSKRMFAKQKVNLIKRKEKAIADVVTSLYDIQNPNHPLQMGSIHFDAKRRPKHLIGTSPIFWYPIRPDILKEIYFQNIYLLTLFNPTQFFLDLKKIGLDFYKDENDGKIHFGKMIGLKKMQLQNIDYFLALIRDHLQTEEACIEAIRQIVSIAESKKDEDKPFLISPELYHISTAYNLDKME